MSLNKRYCLPAEQRYTHIIFKPQRFQTLSHNGVLVTQNRNSNAQVAPMHHKWSAVRPKLFLTHLLKQFNRSNHETVNQGHRARYPKQRQVTLTSQMEDLHRKKHHRLIRPFTFFLPLSEENKRSPWAT